MFFFSLFVFRRWNRPRDRTRHIDDFNSTDVITKERKPPRADGENLALLSSPPRSISIIIPTVLVIHPQSIFLSHDGSYLPQNVQPSASWQRAPHLMKNWAKLNTHGHSLAGRRPSFHFPTRWSWVRALSTRARFQAFFFRQIFRSDCRRPTHDTVMTKLVSLTKIFAPPQQMMKNGVEQIM